MFTQLDSMELNVYSDDVKLEDLPSDILNYFNLDQVHTLLDLKEDQEVNLESIRDNHLLYYALNYILKNLSTKNDLKLLKYINNNSNNKSKFYKNAVETKITEESEDSFFNNNEIESVNNYKEGLSFNVKIIQKAISFFKKITRVYKQYKKKELHPKTMDYFPHNKIEQDNLVANVYSIYNSNFKIIFCNNYKYQVNSDDICYYYLYTSLLKSLKSVLVEPNENNIIELLESCENLDNCLYSIELSTEYIKDILKYYETLHIIERDEEYNHLFSENFEQIKFDGSGKYFNPDGRYLKESILNLLRDVKLIDINLLDTVNDHLYTKNYNTQSLRNEDNRSTLKYMIGFSFSPCGFLIPYHLGVINYLSENNIINCTVPMSGASSGSLSICSFVLNDFSRMLNIVETLSFEYRKKIKSQRSKSKSFDKESSINTNNQNNDDHNKDMSKNEEKAYLDDILKKYLNILLFKDSHKLINERIGRINVVYSLMKFLRFKSVYCSEFESVQDLVDSLRASSFIPFLSSDKSMIYKNQEVYDGQLSLNSSLGCPETDSMRTIRVNPYDFTSISLSSQVMKNEYITPYIRNFDNFITYYKLLKSVTYRINLHRISWLSAGYQNCDTYKLLEEYIENLYKIYDQFEYFYYQEIYWKGDRVNVKNVKQWIKSNVFFGSESLNFKNSRIFSTPEQYPVSSDNWESNLEDQDNNKKIMDFLTLFLITVLYELVYRHKFNIKDHFKKRDIIKLKSEDDIFKKYGRKIFSGKSINTTPFTLKTFLGIMKISTSNFEELRDDPFEILSENQLDKYMGVITSNQISFNEKHDPNSGLIKTTESKGKVILYKRKLLNLINLLNYLTPPFNLIYSYCDHKELINSEPDNRAMLKASLYSSNRNILRCFYDLGKCDAHRWVIHEYIKFENYIYLKILIFYKLLCYEQDYDVDSTFYLAKNEEKHLTQQQINTEQCDEVDILLKRLITKNFKFIDKTKLFKHKLSDSNYCKYFKALNKFVRNVILDGSVEGHFTHMLTHTHFWNYNKHYKY